MKLMTFSYGNEVKIGLVRGKGIIDIAKRLEVSSLKQLIADDNFTEVLKYINENSF